MTEFAEVEEVKTSKYNSALSQLYRLDALWQDSHKHAREMSYTKLNEDLDRIWLELSSDANTDDKKEIDGINEKLAKVGIYGVSKMLKNSSPLLFSKIIVLQKNYLMKKEEFLRRLLNKQGKGSAYQDDIADYME